MRKFFDTGLETAGGAGTEPGPLDNLSTGDSVDLSQLPSDFFDTEGTGPDLETEDTASTEATPAAEATPAGETEKVNQPEAETPESIAAPAAEATPEAAKPQNWQEVLLGQDRLEVLKAMGLDDFDIQLLEHRKAKGNLNEYFKAAATDVDAIPAEELKREQLRERYPNLSDKAFEKLYQKEVVEKYHLSDLDDPEDKELGLAMLEEEAAQLRASKKESLSKLLDAGRSTEVEALRQQLEAEETKEKQEYDAYVDKVTKDPVTQSILQSKKLVLGDGKDVVVNYELDDTKHIEEAIRDTNAIFRNCVRPDGSYDLNRFHSIVAYARDKEKIEREIFKAGQNAAKKAELNEHINPDRSSAASAAPETESLGQAFAKRGRSGTLGELLGQ